MTADPTRDDLLERARELDVQGRSTMNKPELEAAIAAAETESPTTADASAPAQTNPDALEDGLDHPISVAEQLAAERERTTRERN